MKKVKNIIEVLILEMNLILIRLLKVLNPKKKKIIMIKIIVIIQVKIVILILIQIQILIQYQFQFLQPIMKKMKLIIKKTA